MTPLNRVRIEKAAADCGFEMTLLEVAGGLTLRSARFPETVSMSQEDDGTFRITAVSVRPSHLDGCAEQ